MRHRAKPKPATRCIVGLMSGTSADGIDAVVAEIRDGPVGLKASVVAHIRQPFTRALRARILDISLHGTVAQICELNFLLGHHFANAALRAIRQAGLTASQVTAIGSHGQTIHHLPNARPAATLQIGEPAVIADNHHRRFSRPRHGRGRARRTAGAVRGLGPVY